MTGVKGKGAVHNSADLDTVSLTQYWYIYFGEYEFIVNVGKILEMNLNLLQIVAIYITIC
jgi:hypothetical protein